MADTTSVRRDRAKRPRLGGDMITVLVGPEATATKFFVHADLIAQHSDFFQAALKTGWKEAEERVVRLPDLPNNSSNAFEDFHSFLYTGKVFSAVEDEVNPPGCDKEWRRLTDSWILGEVLLSVTFKDSVVGAILRKMALTGSYPTGMHGTIYQHSFDGSAVRRLLVDIAVYKWDEKESSLRRTTYDQAAMATFFQDVFIELRKLRTHPGTAKTKKYLFGQNDSCHWHEHGDLPCYKTMF